MSLPLPSGALALPPWGSLYSLPMQPRIYPFPQELPVASDCSPGRQAPVRQPGERKLSGNQATFVLALTEPPFELYKRGFITGGSFIFQ